MGLLYILIGLLTVLSAIFIIYYKWSFNYWRSQGVPYLTPRIPFGNGSNPFTAKRPFALDCADVYLKMKLKGHKFCGMYGFFAPLFMPLDLDLIKSILTKNFEHFVNRGMYYNEELDPLSANLIALDGEKWRNLRTKLTPTFTSSKIKLMFQTLLDCAKHLEETVRAKYVNNEALDVKELIPRYTIDVIGSCAFGLECNSFKDNDSPFRKYGTKYFDVNTIRQFKTALVLVLPEFARRINLIYTPKDVGEFFIGMVRETIEYREKTGLKRNDFMQLLIELKNDASGVAWTFEEVAAQAFMFFLAGFETSSTTISFALYELAHNQDVQDKLRREINDVLVNHKNQMTYEAVMEMSYLQQVIDETLRLYPSVPVLLRICNKDYKIPASRVVLKRGQKIFIPIFGMHRDPEYFPDPNQFEPDRFSVSNKSKIKPYSYLPFGEGPRNCLGIRFGLLQVKIAIISLVQGYKLKLNAQTPSTLNFNKNGFILNSKERILLDVETICG